MLVASHNYPGLQVTCLMKFALINFIYTISVQPYETNNKGEIFNEFCIIMCAYLMNTFL